MFYQISNSFTNLKHHNLNLFLMNETNLVGVSIRTEIPFKEN